MESTVNAKRISYDYKNQEDKHYFGGFLNLAQNNIEETIEALGIRNQVFKKEDSNKKNKSRPAEIIAKVFQIDLKKRKTKDDGSGITYAQWESNVNFLKQYLPIVQFLNLPVSHKKFDHLPKAKKEKAKRDYFIGNFLLLIDIIGSLRHYYTHYHHKQISIEPELFTLLDEIFLHTCLVVKKRKMKSEKTRELLKRELEREVDILKKLKLAALKKQKEDGVRVSLDDEHVERAVLNESFNYLLAKRDNVYKVQPTHCSRGEDGTPFSRSGLVFLVSMFLTKKQGEDFRSRIKGFKEKIVKREENAISPTNNSLRFMATHWVFSYWSYKGFKAKLNTTFSKEVLELKGIEHRLNTTVISKEALLAQIVDELSKVPDEVYEVLSLDKRNEFLEDVNEYIRETREVETLDKSIVEHSVIRKRYESKFGYLALRYLDEFVDFPSLRFQVRLGNYVHDSRTKVIEGTKLVTERQIKEPINVFGKLSKVKELKTQFFLSSDDEENSMEIFPNPSYCFVENNIPIIFSVEGNVKANSIYNKIKLKIRTQRNKDEKRVDRSGRKFPKSRIFSIVNSKWDKSESKKVKLAEPMALLSFNELPSLLYELLHKKKTPQAIEDAIVEKYVEQFEAIENFDSQSTVQKSRIPKKMKKSDKIGKLDYEKLVKDIDRSLAETKEKRKLLLQKQKDAKENNKQTLSSSELGQEAVWLSDDIKRLMPRSSRKEWKGRHHSHLQYTLAFYDVRKKEALALLENFWDMDKDPYWGEKLKNEFNANNTFEYFYFSYLNLREGILSTFLDQIEEYKDQPGNLKKALKDIGIVFQMRKYRIKPLEDQKTALLAKPILLPRGIFDPKPTFIKKKRMDEFPDEFAEWYTYANAPERQFQRFYAMERDYQELWKTEKDTDPDFKQNKKGISEEQQIALFKMKQDLKIKKIKTQDLFLKLIAEQLYLDVFGHKATFSLSDMYQTKEERREIERLSAKQSNRAQGDKSDNIVSENYIWNKTVGFKDQQLEEPCVKLKDIGKIRRFVNNEKVQKLFAYNLDRIWTKRELEDELEMKPSSYEVIRREKLLKEVQNLEKYILKQYGFDNENHPSIFERDGNPNFNEYVVQGILKKKNLVSEDECDWFSKQKIEKIKLDTLRQKSDILIKAYILILIRNTFAHNQLPDKECVDLMQEFCQKDPGISYSEYFLYVFQQIAKEFTNA